MKLSFYMNPQRLALLVLPICFVVSAVIMRVHAGPFWLWSNLDPDYWYLFDSLNIVNLNWPQHIAHPGTTVQTIGAALIRILHPLSSIDEINHLVLADTEHYLFLTSLVLIGLVAVAIWCAGLAAFAVFGSLSGAMLLQMGPFLSRLMLKHMIHVAPEPLLVFTVMALATVMILALRPGEMDRRPVHYVLAFALIAGFGIATKVTFAGMYLMPLFLIARPRLLGLYGIGAVASMIFFTLPAAGSYSLMFDWLGQIGASSGHFGAGTQAFIDMSRYPGDVLRVASRPIFVVVLVGGVILVALARLRAPLSPLNRVLAGVCLAFVGQALLVGKHPAGHYMIPALSLAGFGFLLIRQHVFAYLNPGGRGHTGLRIFFVLLVAGLAYAQGRAIMKLDDEFSSRAFNAAAIDETPYKKCARIYFWPASNHLFAMHQASYMTGNNFTAILKDLYPDPNFLYSAPDGTLSNWTREYRSDYILKNYPCIFARGERPGQAHLPKNEFIFPFDSKIFTTREIKGWRPYSEEIIFLWGMAPQ